jgi:hypothetical protein
MSEFHKFYLPLYALLETKANQRICLLLKWDFHAEDTGMWKDSSKPRNCQASLKPPHPPRIPTWLPTPIRELGWLIRQSLFHLLNSSEAGTT